MCRHDTWSSIKPVVEEAGNNITESAVSNLLSLEPVKSCKIVPIITPENSLVSDFSNNCPRVGTEKLVGILTDSHLTFEAQINSAGGRLIEASQILIAIKPVTPPIMRRTAARGLINSCLYFSNEIYFLASDKQLKKIQLRVNSIGRQVLRKKRREHVSNFAIYNKLGIFPIKVLCTIQTPVSYTHLRAHET